MRILDRLKAVDDRLVPGWASRAQRLRDAVSHVRHAGRPRRVVRLAGPADLPAVYALRHEVFVVGQAVPEDMERDEHDDRCDHAVALVAGQVVGTGRLLAPELLGRSDGVGVVGRMAVAEPARRTGTGAAVLTLLEGRARERGLAAVELHAQLHARGFYERAGYTAFGEPYDEAGIPHVSMRKPLATDAPTAVD